MHGQRWLPWLGGKQQLTAAKFEGSSREEEIPPANPPVRAGPVSLGTSRARRERAQRRDRAGGCSGIVCRLRKSAGAVYSSQ